jgi:8-amino-7-oxononanoate synthase
VIYDYLSHASLRDGIRLTGARSFSFRHNDLGDLEKKLREATGNIFVVTETVFSMDGDFAPLEAIISLSEKYGAWVIIDEAHATGIIGNNGEGLAQQLGLQDRCFARIHTFGKACGTHGAVVLGSNTLKEYLVNFSRPFIYTTSLPPSAVSAISSSYEVFPHLQHERGALQERVIQFRKSDLKYRKLDSTTPIQAVVIPGNDEVKRVAAMLQDNGLDVRPILYPSVPKGEERLRIVLHAFNTAEEVARLTGCLS